MHLCKIRNVQKYTKYTKCIIYKKYTKCIILKKKNMKYLRNKVNFYLNYICLVISLYCL